MENKEKIRKQSKENANQDLLEHLSDQEWLRKEYNKYQVSIKDKAEYHIIVAGIYKGSFPIEILNFGINKHSKDDTLESKIEAFKKYLTGVANGFKLMNGLENNFSYEESRDKRNRENLEHLNILLDDEKFQELLFEKIKNSFNLFDEEYLDSDTIHLGKDIVLNYFRTDFEELKPLFNSQENFISSLKKIISTILNSKEILNGKQVSNHTFKNTFNLATDGRKIEILAVVIKGDKDEQN